MYPVFDIAPFIITNYDTTMGSEKLDFESAVISDGTGAFTSGNTFSIDVQRLTPAAGPIVTQSVGIIAGNAEPLKIRVDLTLYEAPVIDETYRITFYDTAGGIGGATRIDDIVLLSTSCFVDGTLIRTPTGDVRVEDLKVGDSLISVGTLKDRQELVRYSEPLEKRIVRIINYTTTGKLNRITRPVKIVAGAFGENLPTQDLFVSPWHAFVRDGVLKSAENMLNGSTIDYAQSCESAEYYHVELEEHSAIIANGVETESFYDDAPPARA